MSFIEVEIFLIIILGIVLFRVIVLVVINIVKDNYNIWLFFNNKLIIVKGKNFIKLVIKVELCNKFFWVKFRK